VNPKEVVAFYRKKDNDMTMAADFVMSGIEPQDGTYLFYFYKEP